MCASFTNLSFLPAELEERRQLTSLKEDSEKKSKAKHLKVAQLPIMGATGREDFFVIQSQPLETKPAPLCPSLVCSLRILYLWWKFDLRNSIGKLNLSLEISRWVYALSLSFTRFHKTAERTCTNSWRRTCLFFFFLVSGSGQIYCDCEQIELHYLFN